MFKSIIKRINSKQLALLAGFTVAMFGAISLGIATKQLTSAASVRDTDRGNSIINDGSIGCLTLSECVSDIKANKPGDLQTIYANRGMSPSEIERFAQTAKPAKVYKDGRIVVDGQVVATNAWSMGRETWSNQRDPIDIGGKRYYMSPTTASFASSSIDAFVMFNDAGEVEFAMLTACGNPVWGNNNKPSYGCKALNKTPVSGEKNTYNFTTTLDALKLATVNKVVYEFGDGSAPVTKTNPAEAVKHTYTKVGTHTATVTVYFNVPGGKVVSVPPTKCKTTVIVIPPFYSCDIVLPRALNDEKTRFRFTVKATARDGASLKDADFTVDSSSTVTGVTAKDAEGNIYKEYDFARDGKEHKVVVKVNFNVATGVASKTCEAKIVTGETPKCIVPGKEYLPVDSPECVENCPVSGKTHLPKNSPECKVDEVPPAELPKTGMGNVVGLFAGTSAIGAVAHRVISGRRQRFDA